MATVQLERSPDGGGTTLGVPATQQSEWVAWVAQQHRGGRTITADAVKERLAGLDRLHPEGTLVQFITEYASGGKSISYMESPVAFRASRERSARGALDLLRRTPEPADPELRRLRRDYMRDLARRTDGRGID